MCRTWKLKIGRRRNDKTGIRGKPERGAVQVRVDQGIIKTMEELERMRKETRIAQLQLPDPAANRPRLLVYLNAGIWRYLPHWTVCEGIRYITQLRYISNIIDVYEIKSGAPRPGGTAF